MGKQEAGDESPPDWTPGKPADGSRFGGTAASEQDVVWEGGSLRIDTEGDVAISQYPDRGKLRAETVFQEKWTKRSLKRRSGGRCRRERSDRRRGSRTGWGWGRDRQTPPLMVTLRCVSLRLLRMILHPVRPRYGGHGKPLSLLRAIRGAE